MRNQFSSNLLQINRSSFVVLLLISIYICAVLFAHLIPFRINTSSSMGVGLYYIYHSDEISKGDYVAFCLPTKLAVFALNRSYLHSGDCPSGTDPLLKQVAAISDDVVFLSSNGVVVNHKQLSHSNVLMNDHAGKQLNHVPFGLYQLNAAQVWLYGVVSGHSWDSRYFGPVDKKYIIGVVKPLLTSSMDR